VKYGVLAEVPDGKAKRKSSGLGGLANCIGLVLTIASIVQELRKPPNRRTWHGALFGRIPYDWRWPTVQRVRRAFWQPRNPHLLQPAVFGVGWSINVAAVLRPLGRLGTRP
jgi:hypothetical protein